jgi:leader peptidase (prepilin peptidase)/N-methyltransferase
MKIIFSILFGAITGSFLNLCIDRLPLGKSLISPRSHCDACGRTLASRDLVPIISYVALRGRCRVCGAPIPRRVLAVELGTGLLFGLIWMRFGDSLSAVLVAVYSAFLIVVLGIDLKHHKVPNRLTYPAIALALITAPLIGGADPKAMLKGGVLGLLSLFVIGMAFPGGMGMGDAKLAGFIGLAVGYPGILLALLISFIAGGVIAGALLIAQRIQRDAPIAFAPFLSLGAITTMLYGPEIMRLWIRGA